MSREKKPLVEVEIECPDCHQNILVKVYRKRLNPADKPDYEVTAKVILQGDMFKKEEKERKEMIEIHGVHLSKK